MSVKSLRRLQCRLIWMLVIYFVAGSASQKLVPGVDEIFPFFGWSLFSKVPNEGKSYTIRIDRQGGRKVDPPVEFLKAPHTMVRGNRYIARKVIQKLGTAQDRGETAEVARLRALLEQNHLRGRVGYTLLFERYHPLVKWRTGENIDQRELIRFEKGASRDRPAA